eukprot:CAMPEP_0196755588 /NCGR_PEP_ID=MMETSP1091-20130531/98041_1 /TAXON_ID=302021 /ORGANISM="Rhodomonas sp., Strain CCMP768" /LENGTH=144 /DNA_ID=CAMNT_0042104025 /DNA_START=33 /DNA_END=468 /DNA_ORIENTATION=-
MRAMLIAIIACVAIICASAANVPTAPLRLRGGGVLSSLADSLGWHRGTVGAKELGCGPLPQVKNQNRHTDIGKGKKKADPGDGMTRSHSFTIPDIANSGRDRNAVLEQGPSRQGTISMANRFRSPPIDDLELCTLYIGSVLSIQ